MLENIVLTTEEKERRKKRRERKGKVEREAAVLKLVPVRR